MYGGYMALLSEVGLSIENIDRIILAGGFGSSVDLEKAMIIGLSPEMATEKVTYVGNGSLMGAIMSALTNLFLPHTDMNRFPKLKQRLEQKQASEQ